MADEPCRWFPVSIDDHEEVRVVVRYANGYSETKLLSAVLNAILTVAWTGEYPGTGPIGPGGAAGDGKSKFTGVASEFIPGGKAVVIHTNGSLKLANNMDATQYGHQAGVATADILAGESGEIIIGGVATFSGWNFTVGAEVYISTNGLITMAKPQQGMFWKLGRVIYPTGIMVAPESPIDLR